MEVIKKVECVVVNDQQYRVEGFGQQMQEGGFQSICDVVRPQGDAAKPRRLTFQIFSRDQDMAAEIALQCGTNILSKEHADDEPIDSHR